MVKDFVHWLLTFVEQYSYKIHNIYFCEFEQEQLKMSRKPYPHRAAEFFFFFLICRKENKQTKCSQEAEETQNIDVFNYFSFV